MKTKRWATLGSALGLMMMLQPPAVAALMTDNPSRMCQPTSTTPDAKETRRVQAVLVVGDTVYLGGRFNRVLPPGGGTAVVRNHFVACSLTTGEILPWNPDGAGEAPLNGSVFALATDGTRIFAGGAFDTVGGVPAWGLTALDPNPQNPSPKPQTWGGNAAPGIFRQAEVKALALSEDRSTLYIGGTFLSAGPIGNLNSHPGVAKINIANGAVAGWKPDIITETVSKCPPPDVDPTCIEEPAREIEVRAIVVRGTRVVIGGFFTEQSVIDSLGSSYNGEGHVAAFNTSTAAAVPWSFKPNYAVYALQSDAQRAYVAGAGKGVSKNALTAADWSDGKARWTNYADGNWQALWYNDNVIYGGGHMRRCGTKTVVRESPEPLTQRMCAFDGTTGQILGFAPTTETVGELGVFGIHGAGGAMVAVGEFSKVDGKDQRGAVRFGSTTTGGGIPIDPGTPINPGTPISPSSPGGYRLVASDGGIFSYGDARFFGSTGNIRLAQPIVGMSSTPSGNGYWMVASDGGIFAFGDARFFGSTGNIRLNQPIVGMTATPGGNGYWMVASDGGIFAFGDATFKGSTGNIRLAKPITAMTSTRTGSGYWMTATDGGIFAFGDARFFGSTGGQTLARPIVAMSTSRTGNGYLLVGSDGAVYAFGDAVKLGSLAGQPLARPIVGAAAS